MFHIQPHHAGTLHGIWHVQYAGMVATLDACGLNTLLVLFPGISQGCSLIAAYILVVTLTGSSFYKGQVSHNGCHEKLTVG